MYYHVCPSCGSHLDPGEKCDCTNIKKETNPQPRERPLTKTSNSTTVSLSTPKAKVKVPRGCMNG